MKILFTGASSFTGSHFVRALRAAKHDVSITLGKLRLDQYSDLERQRMAPFINEVDKRFGTSFGDAAFDSWLDEGFDTVCMHGAKGQSAGHDSADFDVIGAVEWNTWNIASSMRTMKRAGVKRIFLTGTYFERWNGRLDDSDNSNPAKNEYALSKTITSDIVRFYCKQNDIQFNKFVIPNPFGPYENKRFTTSAALAWLRGEHITVHNPLPVRDNIHVDLLAKRYAQVIDEGIRFAAPSGYRMTQGNFAMKFAAEMRSRLGVPCAIDFAPGEDESDLRENPYDAEEDVNRKYEYEWVEQFAWDNLASYYLKLKK